MEEVTTAILTDMIQVIESIPATPILAYLPRGKEIALDIDVTQDEAYMFSPFINQITFNCLGDSAMTCRFPVPP